MLKPSAPTPSPATRHRAARGERRGVSTQGPGAARPATLPGLDVPLYHCTTGPLGPLASGSSGVGTTRTRVKRQMHPRVGGQGNAPGPGAEGQRAERSSESRRSAHGVPAPRTMRPMSPSASVIRQRGQALAHLHTTPEQVTLHFGALTKVPSSRPLSYASLQASPLQASEHTSLPQFVQVLPSCRCGRYAIGTWQSRSPRSPARILKLLRLST